MTRVNLSLLCYDKVFRLFLVYKRRFSSLSNKIFFIHFAVNFKFK